MFDDRWYVAPFGSYTWVDSDRGADDGWGGGFSVGKPINEWLNLEFRTMYSTLGNAGSSAGNYRVLDLGVDAQYFFRRKGFQPFLLAGIGTSQDDFSCARGAFCNNEHKDWSFMANAGAGFLVPINDKVAFRMDGRYRYSTNQGNFNRADNFGDWVLSAGIQIPFGSAPAAPTTRRLELSADTLFAFNKSQLSSQGVNEINSLSRDLDQVSYESVDVTGHTDPIGSDEYNRRLSEDRADSVKGQLVQDGTPASGISTYGMGESQLKVTPGDCAGAKGKQALIDCYQPNRRVEVTVNGVTEK